MPGTALTKYSGTQAITCDQQSPTSFRLRDGSRGLGVRTYNMNNTTSTFTDFTNTSASWMSTGTNQVGTDAHWGAETTYDYYFNIHSRNSIDGAGIALLSFVNYSVSYNNAFWNGSEMIYGGGDGINFSPLTSLDIAGHEITHGLIDFTSQLTYTNESGALNESFADIFGTCIENYGRPTNWNWNIASDVTLTDPNGIRSMSNPNLFNQPDTYLGTNWYTGALDDGGVHINSGVGNFWFYLLTSGGVGVNDIGNSFAVTGITMAKAARIAYRANALYFTSSTDYANARVATIQAAADIYGATSNEVVQTTNAWYAVGVGGAFVGDYYLKSGGSLTNLADWGTATDGTGSNPVSFNDDNIWNVHNNSNVTLNNTIFPISSTSTVNIGDGIQPINFLYTGGNSSIGSSLSPFINFNSNSVFELDQLFVGFTSVKTNFLPNSTFSVGINAILVPDDDYYNLIVGKSAYLAYGSSTVQNQLTINSGVVLDLDTRTLTINGSIVNTTGELKGNNYGASLVLNGSGNIGTLRFTPGFETLSTLSINIAPSGGTLGVVALGSNLEIAGIAGSIDLVQGGINLNGNNLTTFPTTSYSASPTSLVYGHPNSIVDIQSNSVAGNLNMDATANSLKALILNSGGILDLGSQLNILDSVKVSNGTLNTNSFLTLKSTANLKARIADCSGGNILGNVTVETFAPGGITDWSVLGVSGVQGQTFNNWYGQIPMTMEGLATGVTSASGLYFESVQSWNENNSYGYDSTITATSPITPGKGYWVYLGDNMGSTGDIIWSVTGSPVFGNFSYPVLSSGTQSGFNLVSNPYASPISWGKVLAASPGINNAIYIYNPDLGLTTSYVGGVSIPPANGANDVIPMGQGFYIQSSGGTALNFSEATKVSYNANANPLLRSANSVDPAIGTLLHLKVEGEGYSDYAAIRFHANASTSFDTKLDAHKLYDSPGYAGFPGTWTKRTVIATQTEGIDYSVNSLPYATIQNAVIPVIVRVYTTGQYTISSSDFANLQADGNACVVLNDKLTNIFHDLTTGDYVFSINDTTQAARFELTICAKESITTSTLTTGIKANSGSLANAVFISKDAKGIFANLNFNKPTNATISVTNVLGQKIIDSKKVRVTNETVYLDVNTSDQLIFVTVETETEKVTKKFLNFN